MKAARIVGPPRRALAPLAAILLVACATPLLAVDDVMMFEDRRTRFVAFVEQERVQAAVRGEEMMLIPTMRWSGSEQED